MILPQADGGSFLAVRQVNSIYFPDLDATLVLETDYFPLWEGGGEGGGQPG